MLKCRLFRRRAAVQAALLSLVSCDGSAPDFSMVSLVIRIALSKLLSVATCLLSMLTSQCSALRHQGDPTLLDEQCEPSPNRGIYGLLPPTPPL